MYSPFLFFLHMSASSAAAALFAGCAAASGLSPAAFVVGACFESASWTVLVGACCIASWTVLVGACCIASLTALVGACCIASSTALVWACCIASSTALVGACSGASWTALAGACSGAFSTALVGACSGASWTALVGACSEASSTVLVGACSGASWTALVGSCFEPSSTGVGLLGLCCSSVLVAARFRAASTCPCSVAASWPQPGCCSKDMSADRPRFHCQFFASWQPQSLSQSKPDQDRFQPLSQPP